jgi:hypothetical protein
MAPELTTTERTAALDKSTALNGQHPDGDVEACALCGHAVPAKDLRVHLETDRDEIRGYVLSLIRNANPGWVESDGACAKCLEYYSRL